MWVQNGNQNDVHPGLGAVAAGAEVHSLSLLLHKLAPSSSSLPFKSFKLPFCAMLTTSRQEEAAAILGERGVRH